MGDIIAFRRKPVKVKYDPNISFLAQYIPAKPDDYDHHMSMEMFRQLPLVEVHRITTALAAAGAKAYKCCPITFQIYCTHERVRYDLDLLRDFMSRPYSDFQRPK